MEDDKRAEWTEQFAWLFRKEVDFEASNEDTVRTERGREFYSVSPVSMEKELMRNFSRLMCGTERREQDKQTQVTWVGS